MSPLYRDQSPSCSTQLHCVPFTVRTKGLSTCLRWLAAKPSMSSAMGCSCVALAPPAAITSSTDT